MRSVAVVCRGLGTPDPRSSRPACPDPAPDIGVCQSGRHTTGSHDRPARGRQVGWHTGYSYRSAVSQRRRFARHIFCSPPCLGRLDPSAIAAGGSRHTSDRSGCDRDLGQRASSVAAVLWQHPSTGPAHRTNAGLHESRRSGVLCHLAALVSNCRRLASWPAQSPRPV